MSIEAVSEDSLGIEQSRILIVDDDQLTRRLLGRVLERSHFIIDEATSGEEAILRIKAHAPDLILLDVMMDAGPLNKEQKEIATTYSPLPTLWK